MPNILSRVNFWRKKRTLQQRMVDGIEKKLRKTNRASNENVIALFAMLKPWQTSIPFVRIGGASDGGYVMADDFDGIVASFSPGVATETDFDTEIANMGIPSFLIDASIETIATPHELITFEPLFLGETTQGNTISLDDWVARKAPSEGDLLLQIDIEGAEYDCLLAASDETLKRFRQVVIEFHDFELAFAAQQNQKMRKVFARLNDIFTLCHLHANNYFPMVSYKGFDFALIFEATYVRKDRHDTDVTSAVLPHPLDEPCVPENPNWTLPPVWEQPFND